MESIDLNMFISQTALVMAAISICGYFIRMQFTRLARLEERERQIEIAVERLKSGQSGIDAALKKMEKQMEKDLDELKREISKINDNLIKLIHSQTTKR